MKREDIKEREMIMNPDKDAAALEGSRRVKGEGQGATRGGRTRGEPAPLFPLSRRQLP